MIVASCVASKHLDLGDTQSLFRDLTYMWMQTLCITEHDEASCFEAIVAEAGRGEKSV